jgi:hypothetical protein
MCLVGSGALANFGFNLNMPNTDGPVFAVNPRERAARAALRARSCRLMKGEVVLAEISDLSRVLVTFLARPKVSSMVAMMWHRPAENFE